MTDAIYIFVVFILCVLVSVLTRMYILATPINLRILKNTVDMKVFEPESDEDRPLSFVLKWYKYAYNKSI